MPILSDRSASGSPISRPCESAEAWGHDEDYLLGNLWNFIKSMRKRWKSVGPARLGTARLGSARHGSARLGLARPSICQRFATDLLRILQQFVDYSPPICRRFADIYHRRSTDEPVYRRADYCTTWDFLSLYFGWIWI